MTHKILVTGAAGFIGYHLSRRLAARGDAVIGVDNLNDYYDVRLKENRLRQLEELPSFVFRRLDLADATGLRAALRERAVRRSRQSGRPGRRPLFDHQSASLRQQQPDRLHQCAGGLPARGRAPSGLRLVEFGLRREYRHAVFRASQRRSSPELVRRHQEGQRTMAHTYSHLYRLPTTGLRFFTVYGPWGRPDMALFLFTKAILAGRPIDVFNHGDMRRDFTYVDDIVEGVIRVLERIPQPNPQWSGDAPDPGTSNAPYKLYNIGNNQPVELLHLIATLEQCLGKTAVKNLLPMQAGDVPATYADVDDLIRDVGFKPSTPIEEGVARFVEWYRWYHETRTNVRFLSLKTFF